MRKGTVVWEDAYTCPLSWNDVPNKYEPYLQETSGYIKDYGKALLVTLTVNHDRSIPGEIGPYVIIPKSIVISVVYDKTPRAKK